jgi:hypothetical protein
MATKRTGRTKTPKEWTPQMQFSKHIARVIMVYWLIFITGVFVFLVINKAIDAMLALTGWVTAVMITMVGAYTGNSIYEKHLDKGLGKDFYVPKLTKEDKDDEEDVTDGGNG